MAAQAERGGAEVKTFQQRVNDLERFWGYDARVRCHSHSRKTTSPFMFTPVGCHPLDK